MRLSKSVVSASILTAVAVGSLAGVGAVNAFDKGTQDGLADRIAADTGADRDKVAASIEAYREEMHTKMEEKQSERLQNLVDKGTITAEQKAALEAKHTEMETERKSWQDQGLSREEIRAKMEEGRAAFEAWAKEQGIDLEAIRPEGGPGGPGGMHGRGHMDMNDESNDSSEPSSSTDSSTSTTQS